MTSRLSNSPLCVYIPVSELYANLCVLEQASAQILKAGGEQESYSIARHLIPWRQGLLLDLELGLQPASQRDPLVPLHIPTTQC